MSVTAGTTVSQYQILEKLGGGGMGVVYKARDTKLDRLVALKFLPPHLAHDEELKQRFIREAKAASALDHNHICTIYDIDETEPAPGEPGDDQMFIAMAHYEGETLKHKIERGPLPVNEAAEIASQIAEGLAQAHKEGIVHRDIKPANIFVTNDGVVKILDFGLAKLLGQSQLTTMGTTMGTVSYMSPEQAQGEEVDHRTDIWSLGVVLYEMLTGETPFKGEYEQAIIYSILKEEPAPLLVKPEIPAALRQVVEKCLRKRSSDRYETTSSLGDELKRLDQSAQFRLPPNRAVKISRAWWIAAAGLVLIAVFLLITSRPSSRHDFQAMTAAPLVASRGEEVNPAFSPDGRQIAFAWRKENSDNLDIYVRLVGGGTPVPITQRPGADCSPAWSPDGQEIAFVRSTEQDRGIYRMPALGGPDRKLHTLKEFYLTNPAFCSLDWSPDGRYLAFSDTDSSGGPFIINLLDLKTRVVKPITSPPPEVIGDLRPTFSPDGRTLAFTRKSSWYATEIFTISASGDNLRQVTEGNTNAWSVTWTQNGQRLIFSSDLAGSRSLWSIPASGGTPEQLPASANGTFTVDATVSPTGNRMAFTDMIRPSDIWRLSRSQNQAAKAEPFISTTAWEGTPRISPDARHIVYASDRAGTTQIWMCDANGENSVELTSHTKGVGSPTWSPDSKHIAYDAGDRGFTDIYIINIEERVSRPVTEGDQDRVLPTWSHDGQWIYFSMSDNIWRQRISDGYSVQMTFNGGSRAFESSDGKWLYFTKSLGGEAGIWRTPVNGGEEQLFLNVAVSWWEWALSDQGIFYAQQEPETSIWLYDFATKVTSLVAPVDAPEVKELSASRDGNSLFFRAVEQSIWSIYVVENFQW